MWSFLRREYQKRGASQFVHDAPRFGFGLVVSNLLRPIIDRRTIVPSGYNRLESVSKSAGFSESSTISLDPPDCGDRSLPGETQQVVHPPRFTYTVENVRLVGPDAIPISEEGAVLLETEEPAGSNRLQTSITNWTASSPTSFFSTLTKLSPIRSSPTRRYHAALSLLSPWDDAYYHWIIEILPRLQSLENGTGRGRTSVDILVRPEPPKFVTESLAHIGYDPDDLTIWDGKIAEVDELLISSDPRGSSFTPSPVACKWLRENIFVSNTDTSSTGTSPSRLYVSRRNASVRRVTNEDEVNGVLSQFGFKTIEPGDYSFSEQVELFSGADVVVGPHGAGLTNLVFSDSPTVIELFGNELRDHYYKLTRVLGGTYHCLQCTPNGEDMLVKTDQLRRTVREALPEPSNPT